MLLFTRSTSVCLCGITPMTKSLIRKLIITRETIERRQWGYVAVKCHQQPGREWEERRELVAEHESPTFYRGQISEMQRTWSHLQGAGAQAEQWREAEGCGGQGRSTQGLCLSSCRAKHSAEPRELPSSHTGDSQGSTKGLLTASFLCVCFVCSQVNK